eukprot:CAMPEP_0119005984 /NCGR_PEP_ID=MMETSP1176-20130426/2046_1 /TAXON_ID=265551 /ORGANISM="Synedropsis recta cf, Strain CCMP1620" /LENGTH=564 /DNA_ID=CAMNT_0006957859 /DNA_START=10 /DNA_END=1704 /DNA_ORIENTATION=+
MMAVSFLLPILLSGAAAIPELAQVHVITRHGARTTLTKTGALREEGKASLTPYGEKQMYDLGDWLQRRYSTEGFIGDYNIDNARFESSHVERTIASANALGLGLFPPSARGPANTLLPETVYRSIPVYMTEQRNDIHIRAYGKCPKFHDRLSSLYASSNWTNVEQEYKTQLTNLAQSATFAEYKNNAGYIPLSELWNVYDIVKVALTECDFAGIDSDRCATSQMLTDELVSVGLPWSIVESLAHFAESTRYSKDTAGDLLGGNLLFRIHGRMGGDTSSFPTSQINPGSGGSRNFYHYSAHYPTIMSVFASLGLVDPPNEVIPGYGAALILELYTDTATGENTIYMLYKETDEEGAMSVKFSGPCEGETVCSLPLFTQTLSSFSYTSPEGWCKACDNEEADICLTVKLNEKPTILAPTIPPSTAGSPPTSPSWAPIADGPVPSTLAPFMGLNPIPAPTPQPIVTPTPWPSLVPPTHEINDEITSSDENEFFNTWPPTPTPIQCEEGVSASTVAGAFLGGIGLGMAVLVALRYMTALRYSKDEDCSDSTDPDNIIDLDFSDGREYS